MKKVEAIIRPYKIEEIKNSLVQIGVVGMTITNVEGFGAQGGHKEYYRNAEYAVAFLPKTKIEIVIEDSKTDEVIDLIIQHAKTGKIGDGKIFIYNVEEVIRVRTGEKGQDAL